MAWHDVRYAVRNLARTPGFTIVALATLALGIGANTAIFSVVRAVLLRDWPFENPAALVQVGHNRPNRGAVFGGFSPQDIEDLRAATPAFSSLTAYYYTPGNSSRNLSGVGEPVNVNMSMVDGRFFGTLGVSAARGRTFTMNDDVPGSNRVVVVSHSFWRGRLAGDPRAVGSIVQLDGIPFEVIGVLPPDFAFPDGSVQLFMPLSLMTDDDVPHVRAVRWLNVLGRLAPGASIEAATTQSGAVMQRLATDYPESNEGWGQPAIIPLSEYLSGNVRPPLLALLAAVGLVLLIACVNVAHLMLARGLGRSREMAIRSALGASRARLLAQLLLESAVLAAMSAMIGLLVAWIAVPLLARVAGPALPRASQIGIDPVIAGFSLLAGVAAFLVVGLMPAIRTAEASSAITLREGRGQSGNTGRLADGLVAAESALAVLLLCGSALALTSLWRLTHVDPGFRSENVVAMRLLLQGDKYSSRDKARVFRNDLLARLAGIPGVEAAGGAKRAPLTAGGEPYSIEVVRNAGVVDTLRPEAGMMLVSPGYFEALSIPLVAGRGFTTADTTDPTPLIVSQSLARQAWPGQDPVGQRFRLGRDEGIVIGEAADVRHESLSKEPVTAAYFPLAIFTRSAFNVFVKVKSAPLSYIGRIRDVVHEVDPDMPISDLGPLPSQIQGTVAQPRLFTMLLGAFGITALLLASIGIYGVVSQGVSRRRREIGIRMALGARAQAVVRMVVVGSMRASVIGIALGLITFIALSRLLRSQLYDVRPTDPVILAAAVLTLLVAAALAAWLPARRAAKVDPMTVLNAE